MQSVPLSPVPAAASTPEWLRTYLPALVGRTQASLQAIDSIRTLPPGHQTTESLVWAVRSLWVMNHVHRGEALLSDCLQRGGLLTAEIATFGHPRHGAGYAWVRVALGENPERISEAYCDLAVLAIRQGEVGRAQTHIEQALTAHPTHIESLRWWDLLEQNAACVMHWIYREPPVSAEAACRLIDLWPDHSNGYLSPCRFRAVRKRAHHSC
ncbi:MAG: hypothetical protein VX519_05055 [Myxococcota bacterium]|nr:hypothetical protein [Myxococcota bacterium]